MRTLFARINRNCHQRLPSFQFLNISIFKLVTNFRMCYKIRQIAQTTCTFCKLINGEGGCPYWRVFAVFFLHRINRFELCRLGQIINKRHPFQLYKKKLEIKKSIFKGIIVGHILECKIKLMLVQYYLDVGVISTSFLALTLWE